MDHLMTDISELEKLEDLTHQFHEKYRTSGIALCISLATLASAEGGWFYTLFIKDVKNTSSSLQIILCSTVIISAIILFLSAFLFQFLNYYGMKHMARSFFHAYKFYVKENNKESKINTNKEWKSAQKYFIAADEVINWPINISTTVNFITAIVYIVLYQPNPFK
jgi:hypothetical protein